MPVEHPNFGRWNARSPKWMPSFRLWACTGSICSATRGAGCWRSSTCLTSRPAAASLTISNSIASIPQFSDMVARLKSRSSTRPPNPPSTDTKPAGTTYSVEYQDGDPYLERDVSLPCSPLAHELQDAFMRMGAEIFETLFGPSDFHIVGTIRGWDVFDRLAEIALPTLVLAGRYDECALSTCGKCTSVSRLAVRVVRVELSHAFHRGARPVRPSDA